MYALVSLRADRGSGVLVAVLITMGLDKEVWGISWIVGVPWIALSVDFLFHAQGESRA